MMGLGCYDKADFNTLRAGIGKPGNRNNQLARLSYDDGAAADDQYRADTTIFGHLPMAL